MQSTIKNSTERWTENGRLHRKDGPAKIWYDDGDLIEEWFWRGFRHRSGGPAWTRRNADGTLLRELWYFHGRIHREDGPAEAFYKGNGLPSSQYWHRYGLQHRDTGPATIVNYYENGESWEYRGMVHRMEWRKYDLLHRLDGPAMIWGNDFQKESEYYLFGYCVDAQAVRKVQNDIEAACLLASISLDLGLVIPIIRRIDKKAAKALQAAMVLRK